MVRRAQGYPECAGRTWDRDGTLEMDRENKDLFITAESVKLKEDTSFRIPYWNSGTYWVSGKPPQFSRASLLGRTAASHPRHVPLPELRGCRLLEQHRKPVRFLTVLTHCS